MWPFKTKPKLEAMPPQRIGFSQLDSTEYFHGNNRLSPDQWIETFALNTRVEGPISMGLPALGSSAEEAYSSAVYL